MNRRSRDGLTGENGKRRTDQVRPVYPDPLTMISRLYTA